MQFYGFSLGVGLTEQSKYIRLGCITDWLILQGYSAISMVKLDLER